MAERSKIEWTDATVNFWWGCTKVSPGCEHCYAEAHDHRFGGAHWGKGVARKKIKSAANLICKLDNEHAAWQADYERGLLPAHCGPRRRVFIQSMADLFDPEVPVDWFYDAWQLIARCRNLDIQIVTKRIRFVESCLAASKQDGRWWPRHAGLIITVTDQAEADRDIPLLLELKTRLGIPWVGLSIEPMLGPINLKRISTHGGWYDALEGWRDVKISPPPEEVLNWVVAGGESGSHARPPHPDWFRSLRDQCADAGVPFLFKQWGEWGRATIKPSGTPGQYAIASKGPLTGFCPASVIRTECYPRQIDLFGGAYVLERIGKKATGRLLDGVEHLAFPGR